MECWFWGLEIPSSKDKVKVGEMENLIFVCTVHILDKMVMIEFLSFEARCQIFCWGKRQRGPLGNLIDWSLSVSERGRGGLW